jgi:hypothetical protein
MTKGETMTTRELAQYIDRKGQLQIENARRGATFTCPVTVIDSRQCLIRLSHREIQCCDRIDVLVEVVGGNGSKWVAVDRVAFEEAE